ncbi:HU family DNA-binding protein [Tateyamaria omphalii]|uniref:HU family DNA-binding protein n=1 Tax=Tateyamaria omphalii TaxID=299262 RepID=UPI001E512AB0|nr:HU family DNA-binding protein [Tateyamaria omphalii]
MMRKKELIDAVVARSGMKKKDIKPAVEATLAVLGEALGDGRALNLQPMGKVKINREKKLASGRLLIARIRQNDPSDAKTAGDDAPAVADTTTAADKAAAE